MVPAGTDAPIVLVGLPGAGKSTAGRLLAERLGWAFVDLDAEIVREAGGRSIPELFAAEGEPAFREREREATRNLRGRHRIVVAPGGGWMANPGCADLLRPPARIIHLHVGVRSALERLRGSPEVRPLLAGSDPAGALGELERRRAAAYAGADVVVDTEVVTLQQVVEILGRLASGVGGA
jgi:shikimate kinase